MGERKTNGLWPNETLRYAEVLAHLIQVIEHEEWFPKQMPDHKPGERIYEGTIVQIVPLNRFICYSRWHLVYGPRVVAEKSHKEFEKVSDAAQYYPKRELSLPGRLDSWVVMNNCL